MFEIELSGQNQALLEGRLDAAQAAKAQSAMDMLEGDSSLDLSKLEYISSAGLGVLLKTHKRLLANSQGLRLINVNKHIVDIFAYSGFDKLFEIVPAET